MATMESMKKLRASREGMLECDLSYQYREGPPRFHRADLVITGLDHSDVSYDVWFYLNNKNVSPDTPRDTEQGYAGRLVVFGHGGCYGGTGHCDIKVRTGDIYDRRSSHALAPQTKIVTVTKALFRLHESGEDLHTITLLPFVRMPRRRDRYFGGDLLKFDTIKLLTYA